MRVALPLILAAAMAIAAAPAPAQNPPSRQSSAVIWSDPGDIRSRNLFYGAGGEDGVPKGPFTFVEEDKGGASPKFEVKDGSGEKWKAKIGPESQTEVVASRLLWAVGYTANVNYHFDELKVEGISGKQKRGREFITADDVVHGVRLQRTPKGLQKKEEFWRWKSNPKKDTREFNGLRVMMALLSNWDLKDDNNGIYEDRKDPSHVVYGVSDVGASFGSSGKGFTDSIGKNNLNAYRNHNFVGKVTDKHVSFNFPTHPSFVHYFPLFQFPLWWRHSETRWIGRNIPREDVKWIGGLLSQLSADQIRDAFRAGGYSQDKVEAYTAAVQARIAEIAKL